MAIPRHLAIFPAVALVFCTAATSFPITRPPVSRLAPVARQPTHSGGANTDCMAHFVDGDPDFEVCKQKMCWLFLEEAPFVTLDPVMKTVDHQTIFPCASPPPHFPRLHGAAFNIMKKTPAKNEMCAWAGPKCAFNHLVNFVEYQSQFNPEYNFAITGLLLETSQRLSRYILPGVSLLQGELVIIGPRYALREARFPLHRMVLPFEDPAWGIFTLAVLVLMVFAIFIAAIFGPRPATVLGLFHFYLGEFSEADIAAATDPPAFISDPKRSSTASTAGISGLFKRISSYAGSTGPPASPSSLGSYSVLDSDEEEELLHHAYVNIVVNKLASYRVCMRLLSMSMGALILIFMIFYEMSVVNSLFEKRLRPMKKSFENLSYADLKEFSVLGNAATEDVFRGRLDPEGTKFLSEQKYPWNRCIHEAECFEWMLNKTHPVKYFVGFKTTGTYEIVKRDACSELTMFHMRKRSYTFGAGWLYGNSSSKSLKYIREMDRAILKLQFSDKLRREIDEFTGQVDSSKCSSRIENIDVGVIGVAVFFFVAPCLAVVLVLVLWQCFAGSCRKYDRRRREFDLSMSRGDVNHFCRKTRSSIRALERKKCIIGRKTGSSIFD